MRSEGRSDKMKYKYNGEYWYHDRTPLLKRLRRWFLSCGWETPRWTREGYTYRWQARHCVRLALRARGHRSRAFAFYSSLCPLSLFGGRLTFQDFGAHWRGRRTYYCLNWINTSGEGPRPWHAYRATNATPWGADTWYFGAPQKVASAAQAQAEKMTADRERRESAARSS